MPHRSFTVCISLLTLLSTSVSRTLGQSSFSDWSTQRMEERLSELDAELAGLAHYTPRSGVGTVGYRSAASFAPSFLPWIEVDLGSRLPIDEVVLVPTIIRDPIRGYRPDGFPDALRVLDEQGRVLAEYTIAAEDANCIAPHRLILANTAASRIRIEATQPGKRAIDGRYTFQLAEVLIFQGEENMALRRPVHTSPGPRVDTPEWHPRFVTDGVLPYLMNSASGTPSLAYLSPLPTEQAEPLTLSVDLGERVPLHRIHLHAVDQSDTIPQSSLDGVGMPRHLMIEGGNQPDFSDATPLLEVRAASFYDTAPLMKWPLPGTAARYLRLVATIPWVHPYEGKEHPRIGFAEIEIFSHGNNVVRGKEFRVPGATTTPFRPASSLTDGRNLYGDLLPTKEWLRQLARRHELEQKRPRLRAALDRRYLRQKMLLTRLAWLSSLLAAGIVITVLVDRIQSMRRIRKIRDRFAADLHDELGANLYAIDLLAQLAKRSQQSSEPITETIEEISDLAKRSSMATRHCVQQLAMPNPNLVEDLRRAAGRIGPDLEHELIIEDEDRLGTLDAEVQNNLFLFYRECLVNISRHSDATEIKTHLCASPSKVILSVSDNGCGLEGEVPDSLKRRARILKGTVSLEPSETGGCRITLSTNIHRSFFKKPFGQR